MSKIDAYVQELEDQIVKMRAAYEAGTLMQIKPYGLEINIPLPSEVFARNIEIIFSEAKDLEGFDFDKSTAKFRLTKDEFLNMRIMGYSNNLCWIMRELKLAEEQERLSLNASDRVSINSIETLQRQAEKDHLNWYKILEKAEVTLDRIAELKDAATQQQGARLRNARQFMPSHYQTNGPKPE